MRMLAPYVFGIGFAILVGWWVGHDVVQPGMDRAAAAFAGVR